MNPKNKIKAVVFDADGMVIKGERPSLRLSRDKGIPISEINKFFDNEFKNCILGKRDLKEAVAPYLSQWGWKGSVDDFLHFWFAESYHNDEKIIADNLVSANFNVLQAEDGVEGLLTAVSHHPDLILLDILMPRMDGLTMMQKLRTDKDEYCKSVPIILLTVLSADEDKIIKRISEDEPAYYLVKTDWKMSEVVEKIKERLSRPRV